MYQNPDRDLLGVMAPNDTDHRPGPIERRLAAAGLHALAETELAASEQKAFEALVAAVDRDVE